MLRRLLFLSQAITAGLAIAFIILMFFRPQWLRNDPVTSYAGAVEASSPSVVNVHTARLSNAAGPLMNDPFWQHYFHNQYGAPRDRMLNSLGSGVIVSSDGYILTNYHVISGAESIQVGVSDGRSAVAHVVGVDPDTDLALLKISLPRLKPIHMGRSDNLRVGDVVLAIGDPYGVGQTVTQGIVSALGRSQLGLSTFENFIQTDAAINPGNSGGALVNSQGQLVGINTALYSPSGGSTGIGFATPVNLARGVMQQLIAYGHVRRGYLGVEPQDITPQLARVFQLKNTQGFIITSIAKGSPGSKAGLAPGDVIETIDGVAVKNSSDALNRIASKAPGTVVTLAGIRMGKPFSLQVRVAERPLQNGD
ncbi:MAG: trypsin-like peptidase domain-containing protein [Gammaproteobacteria bacterium]|nr:trypsin-like peptidase domain-containing protein [Gammaproteobacteria bacterium]MDE2344847.1 trypsin-like peptidase domain-containing protein [Gammaproteobacteria bacterium]